MSISTGIGSTTPHQAGAHSGRPTVMSKTMLHAVQRALLILLFLLAVTTVMSLIIISVAKAQSPCPNEHLRAEQPFASGLPDCRAYEMVSPLEKGDDGVSSVASRAAASGEAVSYFSRGSFEGPLSALLEGRYLSRRGVDGWSTRNISPPYKDFRTNALSPPFEELLFTEDLSRGLVESLDTPLVGGEPVGYINLYVADTRRWLLPGRLQCNAGKGNQTLYRGS